jgi:hypothetical protein
MPGGLPVANGPKQTLMRGAANGGFEPSMPDAATRSFLQISQHAGSGFLPKIHIIASTRPTLHRFTIPQ